VSSKVRTSRRNLEHTTLLLSLLTLGVLVRVRSLVDAVVASLLALVLTVTVVSPVQAATVEPEADPIAVAPLQSEVLALPVSTYPDRPEALPSAKVSPPETPSPVGRGIGGAKPVNSVFDEMPQFDALKSVVESVTEFTTTYSNPDGTETLKVSETPMNARNDEGKWQSVETRVAKDSEGRWSTDAHPLDPSFAVDASEDDAFTISRSGYDIGFTLQGVDDSTFSKVHLPRQTTAGDAIVYRDVYEDVDLTYAITKGAIKESLILHDVPAVGQSRWVWEIDTDGLNLVVDAYGSIRFVDPRGTVQVFVPAPTMWDSSGVLGKSEPDLINVATRVWKSGDVWKMSLTPDRAWLTDPDRVYPVTVDPTYQHNPGAGNFNAYKSDGAYRNDSILVGNARNNGNRYWRTVTHFPYSAMAAINCSTRTCTSATTTTASRAGQPATSTPRTVLDTAVPALGMAATASATAGWRSTTTPWQQAMPPR